MDGRRARRGGFRARTSGRCAGVGAAVGSPPAHAHPKPVRVGGRWPSCPGQVVLDARVVHAQRRGRAGDIDEVGARERRRNPKREGEHFPVFCRLRGLRPGLRPLRGLAQSGARGVLTGAAASVDRDRPEHQQHGRPRNQPAPHARVRRIVATRWGAVHGGARCKVLRAATTDRDRSRKGAALDPLPSDLWAASASPSS